MTARPPADESRTVAPPDPGPAAGLPRTLRDPLAEALRLIELASARGLVVRLMGGLAFHARVPTWTARIERERRDIDLATRNRDRKGLAELLTAEGYAGDKTYNALYGHKQLYFMDPERGRPIDVLIDRMEMSHRFEFADRLQLDAPTVPLAEMLLTKLQIARINRKDVLDGLALLSSYPLADHDRAAINVPRIVALTSADWGWWRTLTGNLEKMRLFLHTEVQPGELEFLDPAPLDPEAQIEALRAAVDAAPKSTKWRLRAQIGDRKQWFEEPEEVGHGR